MKCSILSHGLRLVLIFTLLSGTFASAHWMSPPSVVQAQAPVPGINTAVSFFNLISAANRRNRVYREARATQAEMNDYYDNLLSKAREQLKARQLAGASQSQLAVYVKLVTRLERERAAVTQQIEAEKNQARRNFNRSLTRQVSGVVVQSPGAQAILGEVRNTLLGLREAAQAIQAAMNNGKPVETLVERYASRFEQVPLLQEQVRQLGYGLGNELDQALGGVLSRAESVANDMQSRMQEAINEANRLDTVVANLQNQQRRPASVLAENNLLANIRPVQRTNSAVDVAAQAYTNAAMLQAAASGGKDKVSAEDMRSRIRQQLLQQNIQNLQAAAQRASQVDCTGVGQAQYQLAAQQLGRTPDQPRDPKNASYLVCVERTTGAVVHATVIGALAGAEPTATKPAPTETRPSQQVTQTTAEPKPTRTPTKQATSQPPPTPTPEGEIVTLSGRFTFDNQSICPTVSCKISANKMEMTFNTTGGTINGSGLLQFSSQMTPGCTAGNIRMTFTFQGKIDAEGNASGSLSRVLQGTVVGGSNCDSVPLNQTLTESWQAKYRDGQMLGTFNPSDSGPVPFALSR